MARERVGSGAVGITRIGARQNCRQPDPWDRNPTGSRPESQSDTNGQAAETARRAMTPTRCARYSADAWMSAFRFSAETVIPSSAPAEKLPASACSISDARKTQGPAPVTAASKFLFLSDVEVPRNFRKSGRYYYSRNYDDAKNALSLHLSPGLGELNIN